MRQGKPMKNGTNSTKELAEIREILRMNALQLADNTKQIAASRQEHNREMKEIRAQVAASRREHDRDMKEIRALFKQMIRRLAV